MPEAPCTTMSSVALEAQARFFHDAFQQWLNEPNITVVCGRWADGAISELMPMGKAELLPAIYDGCFVGVRELRLAGAPHHLHIDFGRIHKFSYAVAPSVCLAFKPSFEVRLLMLGPGGAPTDRWNISLMLTAPYENDELDFGLIRRYFQMARSHARMCPDLVEIKVEPGVRSGPVGEPILAILQEVIESALGWEGALEAFAPAGKPLEMIDNPAPPCTGLLEEALKLQDASLVIFRDRTLIEFKTERLDGLHRYEEDGHISWQIGAFDDHHCHLSLGAVHQVLFSAEPVPCQGGGLNYTLWFQSLQPTGNPYRRDGYFSIVLNRPYRGNTPRLEVIQPVLDLFGRYRHEPWVRADDTFLEVMAQGPPARRTAAGQAPVASADSAA